jgi:predicted nucleic acid-binding protein
LILLGDIMLAEVLQGFRKDEDFETARQALASLQTVEMLNPGLAVQSVRNYRSLRQAEITVHKMIDCLVATYYIENGVTLLHSDHDFEPFEALLGLSVVHCES